MNNDQALMLYELIKRYACYECQDDCENCKVGELREKCVESSGIELNSSAKAY